MPGEVGEPHRRGAKAAQGNGYRDNIPRGSMESESVMLHRGKRRLAPDAPAESNQHGGAVISGGRDSMASAVNHKRARVGDSGASSVLGVAVPGEREEDEGKVAARMKQIAFGKNTLGYDAYIAAVPKSQRRGYLEHPRTPDPYERQSKRMFDGKVRAWRRLLHNWDPNPSNDADADGTPSALADGDDNGCGEQELQGRGAPSAGRGLAAAVVAVCDTSFGTARGSATTTRSASASGALSSSADMDALLAANMDEMDDEELDAFLATHSTIVVHTPHGQLSSAALDAGAESFDEEEDVL